MGRGVRARKESAIKNDGVLRLAKNREENSEANSKTPRGIPDFVDRWILQRI